MAVCRVIKNDNYTTMSNYHLKDKNLSLKARGLLSVILSLPENWDYTVRGLATICKDGRDAVGAALKELESAGYIIRRQVRDEGGSFGKMVYDIYEQPQLSPEYSGNSPRPENPDTVEKSGDSPCPGFPDTVNPATVFPATDFPPQENTEEVSTERSSKEEKNNIYTPALFSPPSGGNLPRTGARGGEARAKGALSREERDTYRQQLQEQLKPEELKRQRPEAAAIVDSFFEVAAGAVCTGKATLRVGGEELPAETVRARLLALKEEHLAHVLEAWEANTTKVRNPRQYMLAMLYNAPISLGGQARSTPDSAPEQVISMEYLHSILAKFEEAK